MERSSYECINVRSFRFTKRVDSEFFVPKDSMSDQKQEWDQPGFDWEKQRWKEPPGEWGGEKNIVLI